MNRGICKWRLQVSVCILLCVSISRVLSRSKSELEGSNLVGNGLPWIAPFMLILLSAKNLNKIIILDYELELFI